MKDVEHPVETFSSTHPGPEEMGAVQGYLMSVSLASGDVSPPWSVGAPAFGKR